MAIWRYADTIKEVSTIKSAMAESNCPFCSSPIKLLRNDKEDLGGHGEYVTDIDQYWACEICGWWKGYRSYRHTDFGFRIFSEYGAAAALKTLDLNDISLPVEEVRSYLAAKYDARFEIHPRLFELVVASVFRDHGYLSEATAYSNDGGIDVVLRGNEGQQIGVQVKRYKEAIEVEQIRSFTGALFLSDLRLTRGVFVTTSKFQSGGLKAADNATLRGIAIELVDAPKFFESLKLAQREMYRSIADLKTSIDTDAFVKLSSFNNRKRF
jgi:restriction system protein